MIDAGIQVGVVYPQIELGGEADAVRAIGDAIEAQGYRHLVAYDQHRGLFEAVHHRMWDITSGYGEWKINSAFPDVQWQLCDWFLRPMPSLNAIPAIQAAL